MEIQFSKLHENGNDFIVIDEWEHVVIPEEMKAEFAALYCDRHFGIGADAVLFLAQPAGTADLRLRVFQPDGSEAEVCGNGIRCLAKYAIDAGHVKGRFTTGTTAGPVEVEGRYTDEDFTATISLPMPKFARAEIPATGDGEYHEQIGGFEVYAVNTGVPHAVVLVNAVDSVDMTAAPPVRRHATFPEGANVNFVQKTGDDSLRVRTFERGIEDETLSCGTGAAASAAVVKHLGYMKGPVQVETRGGPLTISFEPDGTVKLEGPAVTVFSGAIVY